MHTLTAEEVKTIKAVLKADSFADMTFRRHNLGTPEEVTTVLLSWTIKDSVTGEFERKDVELPWTPFGVTDHTDPQIYKKHGFAHLRNTFPLIAGLIKEDDKFHLEVVINEDYGFAEVTIIRPSKSYNGKERIVYRGYVEVGRPGNFYGTF